VILNCLPVKHLQGRIQLPASKSYTIRAFIIAARGGSSQIKYASECDDAVVALTTAVDLGASVCRNNSSFAIKAGVSKFKSKVFSVGESGTTLRFLLPLLALHTQKARVVGRGTLKGRPNAHLCKTLRQQGMDIHGWGKKESVPIVFNGGPLLGGARTCGWQFKFSIYFSTFNCFAVS